jgi:long-chain acyl-CoA synthetase
LLAHAVAIGDRRRYVTALLVLDEEAAPLWAKAHGIDVADLDGLSRHPRVRAALDQLVTDANSMLARPEQVKRYHVLPGPWTAETGELTPKLSLRRRVIHELHGATIESMYA